jgi:hypothetical protein
MTGLLIGGVLQPAIGLTVIPPSMAGGINYGGPDWATLGPEDYRERPTTAVTQVICHTTGGLWPQNVRPGKGPAGHAKQIADMWRGADHGGGERVHSAAQLIIDFDGTVTCLGDLVRQMAYHAEMSNPYSVGVEASTLPDGSIYEATLVAYVRLLCVLTWSGLPGAGLLPIPAQVHAGPYRGVPLARMETGNGPTRHQLGGPDCAGVFGHRDNTSERGRGDPGDEIMTRLVTQVGFEALDYATDEDLAVGKRRQAVLVARGEPIAIDGVFGPRTAAAMQRQGFRRWRDVA